METVTRSSPAISAPAKIEPPSFDELTLLDLHPGDIFYVREETEEFYHVIVFADKKNIYLFTLSDTQVCTKKLTVKEMLDIIPLRGNVFIRRLSLDSLDFGGMKSRLMEPLMETDEANLDQIAIFVLTGLGYYETQGTYLEKVASPNDLDLRMYLTTDRESTIFEFVR